MLALVSGCVSLGTNLPPDNPEPGQPPDTPSLSTLRGVIGLEGTDTVARPITVHIGSHQIVTTDGHFAISDLETGKHEIQVSAEHYQNYKGSIAVTSAPTAIEITLQIKYNKEDLDLLAGLVYAEAAGESHLGQVAVAASVLNRVTSPKYPNTLRGVIMQTVQVGGVDYYQYSPVLDGRIWELDPNSQPEAYAASLEAIYSALGGQDPSQGATGFYNPSKVSPTSWVTTQPPTVKIGNHQFFL